MKKILASVLAAASVLTMSATAFATAASNDAPNMNDPTKNMTKGDEFSYDVSATSPKIVFDVLMPAKLTAWLNPYKADMKILEKRAFNTGTDDAIDNFAPMVAADAVTTEKTSNAGVASVAYRVINRSTEYAVSIDAKVTTTVETADEKAWTVKGNSVTAGTKGAAVHLVFAADQSKLLVGSGTTAPTMATVTAPAMGVKMSSSANGVLQLDSTARANTKLGLEDGQVEQKGWGWLGKATTDATATTEATKYTALGEGYIQFVGLLAGDSADGSQVVNWTTDDNIAMNVIFKLNVGASSLT